MSVRILITFLGRTTTGHPPATNGGEVGTRVPELEPRHWAQRAFPARMRRRAQVEDLWDHWAGGTDELLGLFFATA